MAYTQHSYETEIDMGDAGVFEVLVQYEYIPKQKTTLDEYGFLSDPIENEVATIESIIVLSEKKVEGKKTNIIMKPLPDWMYGESLIKSLEQEALQHQSKIKKADEEIMLECLINQEAA